MDCTVARVNDSLRTAEERHNVLHVELHTVKHHDFRRAEPLGPDVVWGFDVRGGKPLKGCRKAVGVPAGDNPERPALHDEVADGDRKREVAGFSRVRARHPRFALHVQLLVTLPSPLERVTTQVERTYNRGEQADGASNRRNRHCRLFGHTNLKAEKVICPLRRAGSCGKGYRNCGGDGFHLLKERHTGIIYRPLSNYKGHDIETRFQYAWGPQGTGPPQADRETPTRSYILPAVRDCWAL